MSNSTETVSGDDDLNWYAVRQERLRARILHDLARRDFGAGGYILRNGCDVEIRAMWLASIRPSFDPYALLLVAGGVESAFSIFALERTLPTQVGDLPPIDAESIEIPRGWPDPVGEALQKIDLYWIERHAPFCDGIGYALEIYTPHMDVRLEMSNPVSPTGEDLEGRILRAAAEISAQSNGPLSRYLIKWKPYVRSRREAED